MYAEITKETIKAMPNEERSALRRELFDALDNAYYNDGDTKTPQRALNILETVEDEEYYEANIEQFREYEAKMNEPDFDWGFYSDWHKDMFGYRPHKKVIPVNELHRKQIFADFHAERGL